MNRALTLTVATGFFFAALLGCRAPAVQRTTLVYPTTAKVDQVDDYFGTKVPDPYRWLEDDHAPKTAAWVEAQNTLTFDYLEKIPFRPALRQRLSQIFDFPRYSSPMRLGERYFFYKNDGLQNQAVCYVQQGLEGSPEVFYDPNTLSPDGTVQVSIAGASTDKRYLSLMRREAGSDWAELRVMEVATKKELSDQIRWVKFSGAAWFEDGFFYSAYDEPAPGQELSARNENQKVFYHHLGERQAQDRLVFEDKAHPLRHFSVSTTEDGSHLFLMPHEGTSGNELHVKELGQTNAPWVRLCEGFEFDCYPIDVVDGRVFVQTNAGAPNARVVSIDPRSPAPDQWRDIIPEQAQALSFVNLSCGFLFVGTLKDVSTHVAQYDLRGARVRDIELPALGTAYGFGGWRDEPVLFYEFESFTYPPSIYRFDPQTGRSEVFRRSEVDFEPEAYETQQVFFESRDGTRVPMFVVAKKGLPRDGKNPTYLTGYGGFNSSEQPYFNPSNLLLLESGGVFVSVNLRGGGEYGETWHKAGMRENKQNVFDDFLAAARYLIEHGYTSSPYLGIAGGSNGGLLVGAAMTQAPQLFRVALPAVGVMDMLRFHQFTVGSAWVTEYGSSDDEVGFRNLFAYSPLHSLRPGVCYPATLVTTADHDDRVVPAHSFKFAATLQEMQACDNPVLIRIDTRSGHGSSNLGKRLDRLADTWSFFFQTLEVAPSLPRAAIVPLGVPGP